MDASSHKVTRDGKTLSTGTANECFIWILEHQGQSVHHATTFEGYAIEPRSDMEKYARNIT